MSQPVTHVYEVYIRTTPEKLWDAITNGAVTKQYLFGAELEPGAMNPGRSMRYHGPDGRQMLDGELLEVEPQRKLVQSWRGMVHPDDPISRVTWEITPLGESCKLAVIHEHPDETAETVKGTQEGWPIVLSSLKTLLETGKPLEITWPEEAATPA
jgi:uncharacterized protein YndB with AHSA1/START domain